MTDEITQKTIDDSIEKYASEAMYNKAKVPFHTHNGADATQLNLKDFQRLEMAKGAYFTIEINNGDSGNTKTIDWTIGNKQKITTTASCTLTFTNPIGPCNLVLRVIHTTNANAYVYTYPSTVKWPSGVKPVTTNTSGAIDIITFYFDGTNYWGAGLLNFS